MSTIDLDRSFPDSEIDVSSTNRQFQTSHIIKQNESRSGILNYLKSMKTDESEQPTSTPAQTNRPSRPSGGY